MSPSPFVMAVSGSCLELRQLVPENEMAETGVDRAVSDRNCSRRAWRLKEAVGARAGLLAHADDGSERGVAGGHERGIVVGVLVRDVAERRHRRAEPEPDLALARAALEWAPPTRPWCRIISGMGKGPERL